MRRDFVVATFVVVAGLAVSTTARAGDAPNGIELGLRAGYSLPLGTAANSATNGGPSVAQSDLFSGRIPLWVDAGYRFSGGLFIGGFLQYGFLLPANNNTTGCGQGNPQVSCSGHDITYGLDAMYHLMPGEPIDPWLGLGFGFESASVTSTAGSMSQDAGFSGLQYLFVQAGADFAPMKNLSVGPFAAFSLGEYSSASVGSLSADIQNKALHEWLTIGIRGAYDISVL